MYGIFTYIYTNFIIEISQMWLNILYMDDVGIVQHLDSWR